MPALHLPEAWLERPVRTVLIGAGGTGSHLVGALMALDHAPYERSAIRAVYR